MQYLSFDSSGHYTKCLNVFKEKSGELAKNKEAHSLYLPSFVRKVLQASHGPQFNVLSVGSGDGVVDLQVLQIVRAELQRDNKCRDMKIFNRAIEPNHHQTSLYKKAIQNLPDPLKGNSNFDIRTQTFQEYMLEERSDDLATKFDLVHFNHSIYYVDPEQTLKHCFEKELQENGHVLAIVEGRDLLTTTLAFERPPVDYERGIPPELFADEIIEVIHKNGLKYEVFSQENEIDVTQIFDEDSIQGNLLLDFFTFAVNFRNTADKAHIDKVLSVMQDKTIVRDGKRFGKKIDDAVFISK